MSEPRELPDLDEVRVTARCGVCGFKWEPDDIDEPCPSCRHDADRNPPRDS